MVFISIYVLCTCDSSQQAQEHKAQGAAYINVGKQHCEILRNKDSLVS
jgi:hypothetical protein